MSMTITTGDDRDDDLDTSRLEDEDALDGDDSESDRRGSDRDREGRRAPSGDVEEDTDDDEDKSPEELRAEIKRLRSGLAKANSSGNRRRQQLKELRAANAALSDQDPDDVDDPDDDEDEGKPKNRQAAFDARTVQRTVSKAVKRRERELEEQHRRDLIDTRADTALTRAGVSEKNIRLLKRELDYEELELLKDRSVDGLDEEIDRLRTEFPDLFKRNKAGVRRINGGDDRESGRKAKVMTASERQAASLRGRG